MKLFQKKEWQNSSVKNQISQNTANEKVVELLLKAGADVHVASTSGLTSLHRACYIREIYCFEKF